MKGTMAMLLFSSVLACTAEEKIFEVGNPKELNVQWRNMELLKGDYLSYSGDVSLGTKADSFKEDHLENKDVFNIWNMTPPIPFRRELTYHMDKNRLELNFQADKPVYTSLPCEAFRYSFAVPLKTLAGMNWQAKTGRTSKVEKIHGKIPLKAGKETVIPSVRWFALEKDGRRLVFDFNPDGVCGGGDFGPNTVQALWEVKIKGEFVYFSFGIGNSWLGGAITGKLNIFEADFNDYLKYHAHERYSYFCDFPVEKQFCFGAETHGEDYLDAGTKIQNDGTGWLNNDNLKIEHAAKSGTLYSHVYGNSEKTFNINMERPGLYLVTARFTAYEKNIGPFDFSADGKKIVSEQTMKPFTVKTVTWPQWTGKDGKLSLSLSGEWALSSVIAQMLLHKEEDYKFGRNFWNLSGYPTPSHLFALDYAKMPENFKTAVYDEALSKHDIGDITKIPAMPELKNAVPEKAGMMPWRYTSLIGNFGPSNIGSFYELAKIENINKRLDEFKNSRVNIVVVNGLLARHASESQKPRVEETVKKITDAAHGKGIKIVDHQDITVLWDTYYEGIRYLCAHTDWLQQSVKGVPTRGICITNPDFRKQYFDYLLDFTDKTGIDGLRLDEVVFHGLNYCGCKYCREKFTSDTGLVLPMDESSPLLLNNSSVLWKTWLLWRIQATTDFMVELSLAIRAKHPEITFMQYVTHYGFAYGASIRNGLSLMDWSKASDYIGTEIMSRNIASCYRAVFAFRKLFNSIRLKYSHPMYGLVYSKNKDVAYLGWAINNMNIQNTQFCGINEAELLPNILLYVAQDGLSLKDAVPESEVAVLFSLRSTEFPVNMNVVPENTSYAQCLGDMHIQYDYLTEALWDKETLSKYKYVFAPCLSSMDDSHVEVLKEYARNGGTLFISGNTAWGDSVGQPRAKSPFAEIFGLLPEISKKDIVVPAANLKVASAAGEILSSCPKYVNLKRNGKNFSESILNIVSENKTVFPSFISAAYGKGKIYYCGLLIGTETNENETTVARKYDYNPKKEYLLLQKKIISTVISQEKLKFTAVDLPESVLCTLNRQKNASGEFLIISVLNATGINMKNGEMISFDNPVPPWTKLEKAPSFIIKTDRKAGKAYATSPDFSGRKEISINSVQGGYKVGLPVDLLKAYTQIFIELK